MQNIDEHDKQKCVSYLLSLGIGAYCHEGEVFAEIQGNDGEFISLMLKEHSIEYFSTLDDRAADYATRED